MLLSIIISLCFIPGLVFFYFCFLISLIFFCNGGVKEGALVEAFLNKKRQELYRVFVKFFLAGTICCLLPILWFYFT